MLGCIGSLFSPCSCEYAESIGINLQTEDAEFLFCFCYISCAQGTIIHTDITINSQDELFSSPFRYSFNTQDPSKSISICVQWKNCQSRNWLQGCRLKFLCTCASPKNVVYCGSALKFVCLFLQLLFNFFKRSFLYVIS